MAVNIKKAPKVLFDFLTNRVYFCAVYFIVTVLRSFPMIMELIDPCMKLCFLWGAALLVWDFFTSRTMFKGYKSIFLVLFTLSYGITILTNQEILYDGIKHFIYNAILIFLFYPSDEKTSVEERKKVFVVVNDIFTVLSFIASVVSIGMLLFRVSYTIQIGSLEYYQGICYNRLYGAYISANPGALMSTCTIFVSWITYWLNKKHFQRFRAFYVINGVVQFIYFTLTLSNGGHLAWIVGLIMLSLTFVFPRLKKHYHTLISLLLTVIIFTASFWVFQGATLISRKAVVFLANSINTVSFLSPNDEPDDMTIPSDPATPGADPSEGTASENTVPGQAEIILERVEGEGSDVSNGRFSIWSAALATLKQKPAFGWADCKFYTEDTKSISIDESTLTDGQINELQRANGYMHNAFLQIAVCSGLVGLGFFLIFAVLLGVKYIRSLFKLQKTAAYYPVAAIFVFLMVMLSQMLTESHLLFTRQDVFAHIFWMYLGFGICLIRDEEKHSSVNFAFVCDTPLQVMNATAFVSSNEMDCKGKSDLFLCHQFKGSHELSRRIREQAVFNHVYDFERPASLGGKANKLLTLWRIFTPRRTLKRFYTGTDKQMLKNRYAIIVLSFYTQFSDLVLGHFRPHTTVQIEDGLGSYVTADLESRYRSRSFTMINKYLLSGRLSYHPVALYLHTPALCMHQALPVKPLPGFSSDPALLETISHMYQYTESSLYDEHRVVYLEQPLHDHPHAETVRKNMEQVLPLISKASPLVRLHPRQKEDLFDGWEKDTAGNMWELECANHIGDEHVLMGAFSTAQFTPKMMFDREPTLVFLHKLYGCQFDNADTMIEALRSAYRNKARVITIETVEQLKEFLLQL